MKPSTFDYYRPDSVEEALQLLEEYGDEGKLLAGGQSFIPILNMRMSEPESLIDINHLKELDYIKEKDGYLKIGALTRQSKLEKAPLVKKLVPILVEATSFIGHIQTRNRGTVGGSVVHADPSAELPLTLLTLDAKVTIKSMDEEREANLRDFFITYLTTEIMPSELLTEIQIPLQHMSNGYAFEEFSRRHGDFALVAVACLLDVDEVGTVTSGRLAVGGIDAVPVLAEDAMDLLIGKKLSESLLQTLGEKVVEDAEPDDDLHASKAYRLNLAKVLIKRAIQKAYGRAVKRGDSL